MSRNITSFPIPTRDITASDVPFSSEDLESTNVNDAIEEVNDRFDDYRTITSQDIIDNAQSTSITNLQTAVQMNINVWDEMWENCYWDEGNGGVKVSHPNSFGCASHIKVKPSTTYYFKSPSLASYWFVLFYGSSKNYLNNAHTFADTTFTTPSNCEYITFYNLGNYGTTYNHDISINYPSSFTGYYPSGLPKTNAHIGGLGNVIGMRGWNQLVNLPSGHWTNTTTDTNNDLNLYFFAFTEDYSSYTAFIKETISTPTRREGIKTTSANQSRLYVKHNGSTTDITIVDQSGVLVGGHKYYYCANVDGTNPTVVGGISISNLMLIDLTAMGLDYINSVDDFRAMFPRNYYPYALPNADCLDNEYMLAMDGFISPTINGIKNYWDGSLYHRRIARVDLGSLDWESFGEGFKSSSNISTAKSDAKLFSTKYTESHASYIYTGSRDKVVHLGGTYIGRNAIAIRDSSYSTASTLKQALSGTFLYYELATEQTLNIDANGLRFELLWTNASPSVDFAAQTIDLDLSKYSKIGVVFAFITNALDRNEFVISEIEKWGETKQINITASGVQIFNRRFGANSSHVYINDGYSVTGSSYSTSNSICIPLRIYGIR